MTVSERVTKLINYKKISTSYIAKKINTSDGTIRNFKNGKTVPSLDFLIFLTKEFPNLNFRWLLLGEGEMFSARTSESQELEIVRGRLATSELKIENLEKRIVDLHSIVNNLSK